jgi:hypothetical protein
MNLLIPSFEEELSEHFDTCIWSTSPRENHTAPFDKLKWVKTYLGNKMIIRPFPFRE